MLIVYCETCGHRITDSEIASGQARKLDENQYVCSKCAATSPAPAPLAPTVASTAPAAERVMPPSSGKNRLPEVRNTPPSGKNSVQQIRNTPSGSRVPLAATATLTAADPDDHTAPARLKGARSTSRVAVPPPAQGNKGMVYAGGAVAVVVLIGIVALMSGGGKAPPPVAEVSKKSPPPSAPVTPQASAPQPKVEPKPELPKSMVPVAPGKDDMDDIRNGVAAGRLKDAKDFYAKTPADPWTYKDMLDGIAEGYRSTPAGAEAKDLLSKLKLPEKRPEPPPTPVATKEPAVAPAGDGPLEGTGEWITLFDGKSLDFLGSQSRPHWKIDNGALVKAPGSDDAGQSALNFEDSEFRVNFQPDGAEYFAFRIYQSQEGGVSAAFNKVQLTPLNGQPQELIIGARGARAQAKLNGAPFALVTEGQPKAGRMQIRYKDGNLRITRIEYRKLPPPGAAQPAPNAADADALPTEDAWKSAVNLLPLIDPAKDAVAGEWKSAGGVLSVERAQRARLQIPYKPPQEYDVRMVFTRLTSDGDIDLILPRGDKFFLWMVAGLENNTCSFDYDGNPWANAVKASAGIENNVKCTTVVQVRKNGAKGWLNGKLLCRWKTDYEGLDPLSLWKLRDLSLMGVGSNHSQAKFEKIDILEITGKGSKARN